MKSNCDFLQVTMHKHPLYCWCSKNCFHCCWQVITSQQNKAFVGIFCKICISWEVLTYSSKSDRSMFWRQSHCLPTFRIETQLGKPEILLVLLGGGKQGCLFTCLFLPGRLVTLSIQRIWYRIKPNCYWLYLRLTTYIHYAFLTVFPPIFKIHMHQEYPEGSSMQKIFPRSRHISDWTQAFTCPHILSGISYSGCWWRGSLGVPYSWQQSWQHKHWGMCTVLSANSNMLILE